MRKEYFITIYNYYKNSTCVPICHSFPPFSPLKDKFRLYLFNNYGSFTAPFPKKWNCYSHYDYYQIRQIRLWWLRLQILKLQSLEKGPGRNNN